MKRGRKGQVTIFIVVAIIVIAVIAVIFFVGQRAVVPDVFSKLGIESQATAAQQYIQSCLTLSAGESLAFIGFQGGYNKAPESHFDLGWSFIPYHYDGELNIPSKERVENELADYVSGDLDACIRDEKFEDFDISYQDSNVDVMIKDKEVEFIIDINLALSKEETSFTYELKDFPIIVESQLNDMLEVANEVGRQVTNEPYMICSSCLSDIAEEKNINIDIYDYEEDSSLFVVSTDQPTIPILFRFLHKHDGKDAKYLGEIEGN